MFPDLAMFRKYDQVTRKQCFLVCPSSENSWENFFWKEQNFNKPIRFVLPSPVTEPGKAYSNVNANTFPPKIFSDDFPNPGTNLSAPSGSRKNWLKRAANAPDLNEEMLKRKFERVVYFLSMDHSPFRPQTFELGIFISTAGKSILNLVKW